MEDSNREEESKSAAKREAAALQKLGETLVDLSKDQVKSMAIPEDLKKAVLFAQGISSHGARRRQLQFIGSIMRSLDPEIVRKALEMLSLGRVIADKKINEIKQWQKELMEKGDGLVEDFIARCPSADRQRLRQLIRNANKAQGKKGVEKSENALFTYLRELLDNGDNI